MASLQKSSIHDILYFERYPNADLILLANMPSPPPPYSPGQGQSASQAAVSSPPMPTSAFPLSQTSSPNSGHDYTPIVPQVTLPGFEYGVRNPNKMPASFPPPPPKNSRDHSASRSRPDKPHSIFSISALTSRTRASDHSPASSAIDALQINTSEALARAPGHNYGHGPRASQP